MAKKNQRPLVKVIQHKSQRTKKREERTRVPVSSIEAKEFAVALEAFPELKRQLVGEVEYFEIAEPAPVISQKKARHGVSSRPERAPRVVRVVTADPSLDAKSAESIIKRRRIGDVAVEIIVSHFSA